CGRIGGVGSGRGPPGVCGRMLDGNEGRGGAGRVVMPPGPPGRARFPVAGGSVGRAACGNRSVSFGRSLEGGGRIGIAGTADVPGAVGSSILKRMLGGTTRPGVGGFCGAGRSTGAVLAGGTSSTFSSEAAGAAGLTVFTKRGGASVGATGLAGSGFFTDGAAGFLPFTGGPSANRSPPGSVMPRS